MGLNCLNRHPDRQTGHLVSPSPSFICETRQTAHWTCPQVLTTIVCSKHEEQGMKRQIGHSKGRFNSLHISKNCCDRCLLAVTRSLSTTTTSWPPTFREIPRSLLRRGGILSWSAEIYSSYQTFSNTTRKAVRGRFGFPSGRMGVKKLCHL